MFETFKLRHPDDEYKPSIERQRLLPASFTGLVVGPPGAGKSRVISDMLHNTKALYKQFDLVLFIVPYVEAFDIELPEERVTNCLNIEWITDKITMEKEFRPVSKCLVILDDQISAIHKDQFNPALINLFFNRRKLVTGCEISIIVSTQKFSLFPAKYRSSLSWIILFKTTPEDWKQIQKQHIFEPISSLTHILSAHFRKIYNFVFIKLEGTPGVFLNFEKQI